MTWKRSSLPFPYRRFQVSAPPVVQKTSLIVGEIFEHGKVGYKTPPYIHMKLSYSVGGHFTCPRGFGCREAESLNLKPHMKLHLEETENRRIMNIELKNFERLLRQNSFLRNSIFFIRNSIFALWSFFLDQTGPPHAQRPASGIHQVLNKRRKP